ncbi:acyl-CoA thioesterase [Polynucleobacter sp. IMCC30063]|uniref:acyl-CoA thioesterase n=1 Tax=unclassified Polynucleobacter TaxID=2640945 RepID=UPI001F2C06FB|nr:MULTISPECIES: thioesterase family protein [unclassified Polynucleobacter]MCE7506082.1 acyl-CoA thioesterase [Polynucleobacter sp. IMCC30063]MCE7527246.1 acyl-CoA thioesterase [Polynucleobacter sp. IMCC 30228]
MRIEIPENKRFVHESTMDIRWGDMDAFQHVNNTLYFRYMEQSRIDWIVSLGFTNMVDKEALLMVNGFCNFYAQLSFPGTLIVQTFIGNIGKSSIDLYNTIALANAPEAICAAGGATMVWVDLATNKSRPWPEHILKILQ